MPANGTTVSLRSSTPAELLLSPFSTRRAMLELSKHQSKARIQNAQVLPTPSHRIVVMGAAGVGKTTIVRQLDILQFQFEGAGFNAKKALPTDISHVKFAECNQTLELDLLDTSGYDSFPVMHHLAIQQAYGFLLVCAADSEQSFDYISTVREDIRRIKSEQGIRHFPAVVVANKTDLAEPSSSRQLNLPYAELAVLCDWGNYGFAKCSALDRNSAQGILHELLAQVNILQKKRSAGLTGKIQRRRSITSMHQDVRMREQGRRTDSQLSLPVQPTVRKETATGPECRLRLERHATKPIPCATRPSPSHKMRLSTM